MTENAAIEIARRFLKSHKLANKIDFTKATSVLSGTPEEIAETNREFPGLVWKGKSKPEWVIGFKADIDGLDEPWNVLVAVDCDTGHPKLSTE